MFQQVVCFHEINLGYIRWKMPLCRQCKPPPKACCLCISMTPWATSFFSSFFLILGQWHRIGHYCTKLFEWCYWWRTRGMINICHKGGGGVEEEGIKRCFEKRIQFLDLPTQMLRWLARWPLGTGSTFPLRTASSFLSFTSSSSSSLLPAIQMQNPKPAETGLYQTVQLDYWYWKTTYCLLLFDKTIF